MYSKKECFFLILGVNLNILLYENKRVCPASVQNHLTKYLLHVYVEECVFIPSVHFKIMGGPVYSLLPTGHVSNLNGNNAVVVTIALQEMQHLVKS